MKHILVSLLFLINSCAIFKFDNQEYDRIISIKVMSDTYKQYCPNVLSDDILLLKKQTQHLKYYAKYRGGSQTYESLVMLDEIANGLNNNMSKYYCTEKLNNISEAAEKIAEVLGRL